MAEKKDKTASKGSRKAPSLLEWISGGLGALITIALLGFLVAEALQPGLNLPAVIEVRPVEMIRAPSGYVVVVEASNRSGQDASGLTIEGELKAGSASAERSSATIDYLPAHSSRRAGLIFREDPRRYSFDIRATGYEEP